VSDSSRCQFLHSLPAVGAIGLGNGLSLSPSNSPPPYDRARFPTISIGLGGILEHALGAIKAKATIMAGHTDLYFTVEDMKAEAAYVPQARFRVIPSLWGHMAGSGLNPADSKFIEREVKALLAI